MTTFNLTKNELAAALVLVKSCLDGMGGKRPSDLDNDPYTWVSAKDLMAAGWTAAEAAGTFGALIEKGVVFQESKTEWTLGTDAYHFLDTVWDAQTETSEMENTVTNPTPIIALIDLTNLTVQFANDAAAADASDLYTAGSAPELEDLSGPQAVAIYNVLAGELNASPIRSHLEAIPTTKRFADKGTATKRVWGLIELYHSLHVAAEKDEPEIKAVASTEKANHFTLNEAGKAAVKAAKTIPEQIKAHVAAKTTTTPRRGTGINLAPNALGRVFACREGSKQATLVDYLNRPQGATMAELLVATSGGKTPWKEVSVKSGLNWDMNKIKGYGIKTTKRGDDDCYHLVMPKGMTAPVPHTPKKGA